MKKKILFVLAAVLMLTMCMSTAAFAKCSHKSTREVTVAAATPDKAGKINVVCNSCNKVVKSKKIVKPAKVVLSKTKVVYNGKTFKPTVTVKNAKGKKIAASNYTVKYSVKKGFRKVGVYKVTVKFNGKKFAGSLKVNFTIQPQAPHMKVWDLNAGNGFGLQWDCLKDESQIAGYNVQWADNKSFKNAHYINMEPGYIGWSANNMGLKNGKTYYCRMRSVSVVNKKVIYSKWSNVQHDVYKGEDQEFGVNNTLVFDKNYDSGKRDGTSSGSSDSSGTSGSGSESHTPMPHSILCGSCGGLGYKTTTIYNTVYVGTTQMLMPQTISVACGTCGGTGKVMSY